MMSAESFKDLVKINISKASLLWLNKEKQEIFNILIQNYKDISNLTT